MEQEAHTLLDRYGGEIVLASSETAASQANDNDADNQNGSNEAQAPFSSLPPCKDYGSHATPKKDDEAQEAHAALSGGHSGTATEGDCPVSRVYATDAADENADDSLADSCDDDADSNCLHVSPSVNCAEDALPPCFPGTARDNPSDAENQKVSHRESGMESGQNVAHLTPNADKVEHRHASQHHDSDSCSPEEEKPEDGRDRWESWVAMGSEEEDYDSPEGNHTRSSCRHENEDALFHHHVSTEDADEDESACQEPQDVEISTKAIALDEDQNAAAVSNSVIPSWRNGEEDTLEALQCPVCLGQQKHTTWHLYTRWGTFFVFLTYTQSKFFYNVGMCSFTVLESARFGCRESFDCLSVPHRVQKTHPHIVWGILWCSDVCGIGIWGYVAVAASSAPYKDSPQVHRHTVKTHTCMQFFMV